MGFESRAISARVTKQIVTIFSKTCDNAHYKLGFDNEEMPFGRSHKSFHVIYIFKR